MKKCEQCGKEHNGSYGSGKFCSKKCRYQFIGRQSNMTMGVRGTKKCNFKTRRSPYGTWTCRKCNLVFETRSKLLEHCHETHPISSGSSWNRGLTKESDERVSRYVKTCRERNHYRSFWKGKNISETHRSKISKSMKRFCKDNPDKVPYVLHHSSKESYPERYFKETFLREGFPKFEQDKRVSGYFLDFAFLESKKFVEIDGEQHYRDVRIVEHDKARTSDLLKTEWRCICRIRWSKF